MNSLIGYGSSDEEGENGQQDLQPERPAKIAKIERTQQEEKHAEPLQPMKTTIETQAKSESTNAAPQGPALGPSISAQDEDIPDEPPLSPYSLERHRLRELTMPTNPDFDIPDSPPPPPANSEEAARLAATTKKFEKFLELKKQGVHFNERLENTVSLRNPSLLPKLLDFAGMSQEDSYASSLPKGIAVPTQWPEEWYVENLMKLNERNQKKRTAERDKIDFVPSKSAGSSKTSTPGTGTSRKERR